MNTLTPESIMTIAQNAPFGLLTFAQGALFLWYVWQRSAAGDRAMHESTVATMELTHAVKDLGAVVQEMRLEMRKHDREVEELKTELENLKQELKDVR